MPKPRITPCAIGGHASRGAYAANAAPRISRQLGTRFATTNCIDIAQNVLRDFLSRHATCKSVYPSTKTQLASNGSDALSFVAGFARRAQLAIHETTLAWVGSMSQVAWRRFAAYTPPSRDVGPREVARTWRPPQELRQWATQDATLVVPAATATNQLGDAGREIADAARPRRHKSHAHDRLGRVLRRLDSPKPGLGKHATARHVLAGALAAAAIRPTGPPRVPRRPYSTRRIPQWVAACFSA